MAIDWPAEVSPLLVDGEAFMLSAVFWLLMLDCLFLAQRVPTMAWYYKYDRSGLRNGRSL